MPNRISLLVALEGADEGLKRAISSAERSFNEMSATAKTAGAKAAQGMAELKAGVYPRTPANAGGEVIEHDPNGLGQPTRVRTYVQNVSYHANGALSSAAFGNGVLHTRLLNVRQLPRELKYASGSQILLDLRYLFDPNDNVLSINDFTPGGTQSQSFGYDDLNRLTSATAPQSYMSATFEYDVFDNLRRHQVGAMDWRYRYTDGTNRLNAIQTPSNTTIAQYTYDLRGNATLGVWGLSPTTNTINSTFDRAETMTSITENGVVTSYTYDSSKISAIQKGGSETFSDVDHTRGETITSMKEQLLNDSGYNKKVTPIRIFEQDGVVYILDHRRLEAHIEAGVPIQTVMATNKEVKFAMQRKMTIKKSRLRSELEFECEGDELWAMMMI